MQEMQSVFRAGGKERRAHLLCLAASAHTLLLKGAWRLTYQVICKGLAPAVPESVHKDLVILDSNGAHRGPKIKGTPLEHDAILIIHASALWEDEQRGGVGRRYVSLHPFSHNLPVFHLHERRSLLKTCEALQQSCVLLWSCWLSQISMHIEHVDAEASTAADLFWQQPKHVACTDETNMLWAVFLVTWLQQEASSMVKCDRMVNANRDWLQTQLYLAAVREQQAGSGMCSEDGIPHFC